jgi:hypothetical protein
MAPGVEVEEGTMDEEEVDEEDELDDEELDELGSDQVEDEVDVSDQEELDEELVVVSGGGDQVDVGVHSEVVVGSGFLLVVVCGGGSFLVVEDGSEGPSPSNHQSP